MKGLSPIGKREREGGGGGKREERECEYQSISQPGLPCCILKSDC